MGVYFLGFNILGVGKEEVWFNGKMNVCVAALQRQRGRTLSRKCGTRAEC